jgi:TIR domain-containing protein
MAIGSRPQVFISFSPVDSADFADNLAGGLEIAGFAPLPRHDIAGEDWQARLGGLIAQSDQVLFVISPEAVRSERCTWEVEQALALSKRLVMVVSKAIPEDDIPEVLTEIVRQSPVIPFDLGLRKFARPMAELADALRAVPAKPLAKIFISYRREDTKWPARQMYEALSRHLPDGQVFIDVDSIPPGADFVEILHRQVKGCEMVLALIGREWVESSDPKTGQRRLDNPNDFVRIEICAALSRTIPVIPVLLDGARMPDEEQLPEEMRMLARRQAEFVEYRTFDEDVDRLSRKLGFGKEKT